MGLPASPQLTAKAPHPRPRQKVGPLGLDPGGAEGGQGALDYGGNGLTGPRRGRPRSEAGWGPPLGQALKESPPRWEGLLRRGQAPKGCGGRWRCWCPQRSLRTAAKHTCPLLNPPFGGGCGRFIGQQSQSTGQKAAVETVTSLCSELRDNVLPCPAGGKCKEWKRRRARGCHTGRGEARYLSGSTERVQEEKLKRQQNRNRKSEEGLRSGGEGKQRGLGMAPDPLATGTDAQPLPSTHCFWARREVRGGRLGLVCAHAHYTAGHAPPAPGTAPQR